jgi:hypothetical protein
VVDFIGLIQQVLTADEQALIFPNYVRYSGI